MKLPFKLPSFGKKEEKEYYLALLLREEKISAIIFQESFGRIHIVGHDEEYLSGSLDTISEEELLEVADKAISKTEEALPNNIETQKTIFGLPDHWAHETQIKKDRLGILRKISDELGLAPIGFLVVTEAIAHLLEKEEGAPVSAVLLEIGQKQLQISLLRAGRVIETRAAPLDGSVIEVTDKLLHHFVSHEILPSRIIIHTNESAQDLSQEFIGHTWSRNLPFLHVPQISTMIASFDSKAVLFSAASQMGFEVAHFETPKKTKASFPKLDDIPPLPKKPTSKLEKPEKEEMVNKEIIKIDNEEILEEKTTDDEEILLKETTKEESADFGFTAGTDVAKSNPRARAPIANMHSDSIVLPHMLKNGTSDSIAQNTLGATLGVIPMILLTISRAFGTVTKRGFSLPSLSFPTGNKLFLIPPAIIGLLILLILFYVFGRSAEIIIQLAPKTTTQTNEITFASDKPTDNEKRIIAAQPISVSQEGSVETEATGKKDIGEKAKGSVTIYSISTSSKNLPAGTTITGPNSMVFLFDTAATVASASGNPITGIQPSTTKVSVTAKDIGKEYNLPSGTTFTIDSATSAKNDSAFGGGSKKQVTVVSKADVDKLTAQLPETLSEKAKTDLAQKADGTTEVLPVFSKTTFEKKQLSKNIGDEATTVSLSGTVAFQTMSFLKRDLMDLIKSSINNETKSMEIPSESLTFTVKDVSSKPNGETIATIEMKGSLVPIIDTTKLAEQIKGRSISDAEATLRNLPQAETVQINLKPNLPLFPKNLPTSISKISFQIKH